MTTRYPPVSAERAQRLVDAVDAAETRAKEADARAARLWGQRAAAVQVLYQAVGGTEAARLLGMSRQNVYNLCERAEAS